MSRPSEGPVSIVPADLLDRRVLKLVDALLVELGEENEGSDVSAAAAALAQHDPFEHGALLALDGEGVEIGVATWGESFALYASGRYGVIHEMFVHPSVRSSAVGASLIAAVLELARDRGWKRVEVTAPESPRWRRTRAFYERNGFVFSGPKLRLDLGGGGG